MRPLTFVLLAIFSFLFLTSCSKETIISEESLQNTSNLSAEGWPEKGSVTVA